MCAETENGEQERHFIVPIKQVPDMDEVKFDREEGRIDRSSADTEPNPFDLNALEEAVSLKEEIGGTITAISMGPPQAESTLQDALARGADRAILLTDKAFGGADTIATSLTLAAAAKKIGSFDMIFCGEKTIDGDTGQVGPEIAELVGVPHVAYVSEVIERNDSDIVVKSDTWNRTYTRRLKFPALVTVTKDVNEPRLPSFKDKMEAKKATIEEWGFDEFSDIVTEDDVGLDGSKTWVNQIEIAEEAEREGEVFRGEIDEAVVQLVDRLEEDGILKEKA